mgnify:CR=1 FL=1
MSERVEAATLRHARLFGAVLALTAIVVGFVAGLSAFYGGIDYFMAWLGNALMTAGALPPVILAIILLALSITGAVSMLVSEKAGRTPPWTFAGSVVAAAMYCLVVWAIANHVGDLPDVARSLDWVLNLLLLASFLAGFYTGIGLLAVIAVVSVSIQQWLFER